MRPKPEVRLVRKIKKPETQDKLFLEIIEAGMPKVVDLWENGEKYLGRIIPQCADELAFDKNIGKNYLDCQPHFWQCYWSGGVTNDPSLKVDLFGQSYHLTARASYPVIAEYSKNYRHMKFTKRSQQGIEPIYGFEVDLAVAEIPGMSLRVLLQDTCRDSFLPERVYPYAHQKESKLTWDNFGRKIFIDKFYVTNQKVNEWRVALGQTELIEKDRLKWPKPAYLNLEDQKKYCEFYGKKLMEAHLFDAASMTPIDLDQPKPKMMTRPATPWQRDIQKTFLGLARINPDFQLTPLDCQLAEVQGCSERHYFTDSVSWMGMNYPLGYEQESLVNIFETKKNLKKSSRFFPAADEWHELGKRGYWDGVQDLLRPVAFRCYEELP